MNKIDVIYNESCLEVLKRLGDNSIDAIVTDPPYNLGFMGKRWDKTGIAFNLELWKECLRVIKPGGNLLSFGGTRTYHRMVCAIEDAGFEIRDCIMYCYGSGFPKSLNIGIAVNKLETEEWSKIINSFTNLDKCAIIEVWRNYSSTVKFAETLLEKSLTGIGICMPVSDSALGGVLVNLNQRSSNSPAVIAEVCFTAPPAINTRINTALGNVEAEIKQLQNLARSAGKLSQSQSPKCWSIFTAQCDVKEWLKENTLVNHRVDEVLKTLRGNRKYSSKEITDVLCVVLTDILKLTILSQSKTFQNLDTPLQTECASATTAIITESIMDNLISNTVDILIGKAVDKIRGDKREVTGKGKSHVSGEGKDNSWESGYKLDYKLTKGTSEWEGYGTGLKPAYEPIVLAMKPLDGTFAENCLKWGVGGLNIDGCRIPMIQQDIETNTVKSSKQFVGVKPFGGSNGKGSALIPNPQGRFPANFIHDGSQEVMELFPTAHSSHGGGKASKDSQASVFGAGIKGYKSENQYYDSGSATRFFYCAKASKRERDAGLEDIEPINKGMNFGGELSGRGKPINIGLRHNSHPTVKPLALMEYLVKLVTRPGHIVLDPFIGSGTTALACVKLGRHYIGCELDKGYYDIAVKRIERIGIGLR